MRLIIASLAAGLLLAAPASIAGAASTDLSSQGVYVGPGGVGVDLDGPRVRRERYRERRRDVCGDLRRACMNKDRLGETGEGNCRRYRRTCR